VATDDYSLRLEDLVNPQPLADGQGVEATPKPLIPRTTPPPPPSTATGSTETFDLIDIPDEPPKLFKLTLDGYEAIEWWSGFYPHKWHGIEEENHIPRKVQLPDTQPITVSNVGAGQPRSQTTPPTKSRPDPLAETNRVEHLKICLTRELQSKYGIMAETNHNTRVYQKTLLEVMERLNCTSAERAQVVPYVLQLVYIPSEVMIGAQRFRESQAAYNRRLEVTRKTRLWRGWLLWSAALPDPERG